MLLEIRELSLEYARGSVKIPALKNVSLSLEEGENLGLVGESGSGKSSVALSILRLIDPREGRITSGSCFYNGKNLLEEPKEAMRALRGKEISIVFQDPFSSLNPVMTLESQLKEAILCHNKGMKDNELKERVQNLFYHVRLTDTSRIASSYPHQISGGQRQRVLIAMAIANHPRILICDEPTTALDVTVQKEILDLLKQLQSELKMAILFITHHLGIIANYSHRLAVLYAGEVVEEGPTAEILKNPKHPYTQKLLRAIPKSKYGKFN